MAIFNQYASREQIQDTQSYEITGTVSQNTTRNEEDPKHHNRMSQHINNTKESSKHDPPYCKHEKVTKIRPPEEPNKKSTQKYSTQHKTKIPEHVTAPSPVSRGFHTPQISRGSRLFNVNPYQSQTTGGPPPSHFANVNTVSSPSTTMFSVFSDRFTATASALKDHFPIVQKHLVDFSTLSARCTQQGFLINRIQINLNTFAGVDNLINVALFELPEETTNLTDRFHEAFDLPQEARNARLEELFENDVALSKAIDVNSTELTTPKNYTV